MTPRRLRHIQPGDCLAKRDTPARRLLATSCAVAATLWSGCNTWPTAQNLPAPIDAIPADEDPGDRVYMTWREGSFREPNDVPSIDSPAALTTGFGLYATGELDGTGWFDEGQPPLLTSDVCESQGSLGPDVPGFYIGDVDHLVLDLIEPGRLCVWAEIGNASHGVDLLAAKIDACGVPVAPWTDAAGALLGADQAGGLVMWQTLVDSSGLVSLSLAAFLPNSTSPLPYRIAVALVREGSVCPSLPRESSEVEVP